MNVRYVTFMSSPFLSRTYSLSMSSNPWDLDTATGACRSFLAGIPAGPRKNGYRQLPPPAQAVRGVGVYDPACVQRLTVRNVVAHDRPGQPGRGRHP